MRQVGRSRIAHRVRAMQAHAATLRYNSNPLRPLSFYPLPQCPTLLRPRAVRLRRAAPPSALLLPLGSWLLSQRDALGAGHGSR
eukprot:2882653-Pyramimonas_sp.AAC.1